MLLGLSLAVAVTACEASPGDRMGYAVKVAIAGQTGELNSLLKTGVDPSEVLAQASADGECRIPAQTAEVLVEAGAKPHLCLVDYAAAHNVELLGKILDRQKHTVTRLAQTAVESQNLALYEVALAHTPSQQLTHRMLEVLDAGWDEGIRLAANQHPKLHLALAHITQRTFPEKTRKLVVPSLIAAGIRCDIVCAGNVGQLGDRLLVRQLWQHGLREHRQTAIEAAGLIHDTEMADFLTRQ